MKDNANPTVYTVNNKKSNDIFLNNSYVATQYIQKYNFNGSKLKSNTAKFLFPLNNNSITSRQSVYSALQSLLTENNTGKKENREKSKLFDVENEYDPSCLLRKMGFFHVDEDNKDSFNISLMNDMIAQSKSEIFSKSTDKKLKLAKRDKINANEIFDLIRNIQDPEHPLTLEQLHVVKRELILVNDDRENLSSIIVKFIPTIPHCSMATLIGLTIRIKLLRSVATRFKVNVMIEPGTHASENAINQQLNDKERVIAAMENDNLLDVVNRCISNN